MDKSSFLNPSLFCFQNKIIKLALKMSPYFLFFAVINNNCSKLIDCDTVCYALKKTAKIPEEIRSNTLFLKFKVGKTIPVL
jgi:hypothetical protein